MNENIIPSVPADRWAAAFVTKSPQPTAEKAQMFLQWKDITDFTLNRVSPEPTGLVSDLWGYIGPQSAAIVGLSDCRLF